MNKLFYLTITNNLKVSVCINNNNLKEVFKVSFGFCLVIGGIASF